MDEGAGVAWGAEQRGGEHVVEAGAEEGGDLFLKFDLGGTLVFVFVVC